MARNHRLRLQIEDAWIVTINPLLLLAVAWWGRQEALRFRRNAWLAVAIMLGAVASRCIDVLGRAPYRLLAEDGSKIISTSCMFLLCFKSFLDELDQLSSRSGSSDSALN